MRRLPGKHLAGVYTRGFQTMRRSSAALTVQDGGGLKHASLHRTWRSRCNPHASTHGCCSDQQRFRLIFLFFNQRKKHNKLPLANYVCVCVYICVYVYIPTHFKCLKFYFQLKEFSSEQSSINIYHTKVSCNNSIGQKLRDLKFGIILKKHF